MRYSGSTFLRLLLWFPVFSDILLENIHSITHAHFSSDRKYTKNFAFCVLLRFDF